MAQGSGSNGTMGLMQPPPRCPGQRHRAGLQLLQEPPGRTQWCFSGHMFYDCSRALCFCFRHLPAGFPRHWQFPAHSGNHHGPAQLQRRRTNRTEPHAASVTLYSAWIRWTHSHPSSHNLKLRLHPPLLHPMLRCSEAPRANLSCTSQGRQSTDAEPLRTALQEGHSLQSCSSPIAHSVHIVSPQATNTHDNS